MSYGGSNNPWERSIVRYNSSEESSGATAPDWHKWATLGLNVLDTVGRQCDAYQERTLREQERVQRERELKLREKQLENQDEGHQYLERRVRQQERLLEQLQRRLERCEEKLQEQERRLQQPHGMVLTEESVRRGKSVTVVSQRMFAGVGEYEYE